MPSGDYFPVPGTGPLIDTCQWYEWTEVESCGSWLSVCCLHCGDTEAPSSETLTQSHHGVSCIDVLANFLFKR